MAPTQTSFPAEKIRKTTCGSSILYTAPGNCSGSYMTLLSLNTRLSRSISPPSAAEATMFWMLTTGFSVIWMPWLLSSLTTFSTALRDSFSDLAPVQTIFPVPKIRVAVLGFLRRKTSPGNTLGLYSVWGNFSTICCRSIFWFRDTEATMFWMAIVGFLLLI